MKRIILGILMMGLMTTMINTKVIEATTYVSGTQTGTWDLAGSPYVVTGSVTVPEGSSLTINSGVIVKFATDTLLIAYGLLTAVGTPEGTITFTSNKPTPSAGDWNSIKFSGSGSRGSRISYCLIQYGKQAVYLENADTITVATNTIKENKGTDAITADEIGSVGAGIYLSSSSNNIILGNTISQNTGGKGGGQIDASSSGGIGCGIYLSLSTNNAISGNIIFQNTGGEGGMDGFWYGSGGVGGIGCGIYLSLSINNILLENDISQSRGGTEGATTRSIAIGRQGNGYGIYIESNSYNNTIGSSNTYNGEPIHYFYNQSGITIENHNLTLVGSCSTNLGRIVLINCRNFTIRNNTIAGGIGQNGETGRYRYHSGGTGKIGCSIFLLSSTNTTISKNTILQNIGGHGGTGARDGSGGSGGIGCGIYLLSSTNTTILENIISQNIGGEKGTNGTWEPDNGAGGIGCGIYLDSSNNNIIKYNTIINNIGGTGNPNGNGVGIYCNSSVVSPLIYNNIYNNQTYNLQTDISPGIQTAEYNWWGSDPPQVGSLFGNIDYTPWLKGTYTGQPLITISPISGTVGTILSIEGIGYNSSETIRIDFGYTLTISTTITDGLGRINITFTVNTQPYGNTSIIATGLTSGKIASNSFQILPNILVVSPWRGTVGTIVTISGNGFGATEAIRIDFGNIQTILLTSTYAEGSFTTRFTIDTQPYGTTTIVATGMISGARANVAFVILPKILFVTPGMGTVGSIVMISGNGFGANEGIRIDFGTTANIMQISTTASGSWITYFTIDTQPYGTTTIVATGMDSGARAYSTFKILSSVIFISPSRGTVGTQVRIMGNGFGASEGILISFGMTSSLTIGVSNAAGKFDTTFTVNTQPFGTTTIIVVGLQTGQVNTMCFFILPNIISVIPTFGTVGSRVTIAGNGFGVTETIRVDFGTTMSICNIVSSVYGAFTACFTVNIQPYGMTTIRARGLVTNSMALATVTIVPKIIVSPTSGQVGNFVTVAGNGFASTESVRIEFGAIRTITTASTNAGGGFAVVFTVNSQPIGTTTIVAYGLMTGAYAKAYFVILPFTTLKITPATQNVAVGSTFTCQVEIEDVSELVAGDVYISYNSNILDVIGIGSGTFPPNCSVVNKVTNGKIDYSFGLFSGSATGLGILCSIYFKAIAGGTSSVVFDTAGDRKTTLLKIEIDNPVEIPFTTEDAIYYVINKIKIKPQDKILKADEDVKYQGIAECGSGLELDVTGSTTFTATGGGSFTFNTFHAKYMGTYTIQGEYLGFMGTTSVIILPGTPTTLVYVSGNNQVNTCTFTLKNPFIVKVIDKYNNPCKDVEISWEIIEVPSGATGYLISPTKITTNVQGTASSLLTLGTEPPGTYTVQAIATGLLNSPCIFIAHSLRRFGNIAGFCMLKLGTVSLGTSSDIEVKIVELGTTTTTNDKSYFIFEKIPVGTYTLTFDTWGASPATKTNVCISPTQFEDTTYIGTISLLAGDVNNDGNVNIADWPLFADAWREKATSTHTNWDKYKEADFNHDNKVDAYDFIVLRNNFGQQQQGKTKKLTTMPAWAKKTAGRIELSFDLETIEGVDINELRVGNIIYLKINVRDAKDYLGGEIHLAFNPKVLQVVDANKTEAGIQIQRGDYIPEDKLYPLINKVDNEKGKIDYAGGVMEPMDKDEGVLAIVPFKVISSGAYSNVSFDFDDEENRETMFIERSGGNDQLPEVLPDEVTITVPMVFNNLDSALVYPNPAYKGQEITFDKLTTDKQVTLRIYNVAGELVIEKEKARGSSVPIKWNLRNKDNEYVASGIYIYFLKDEQGSTKRGKIGVIK